MSRNVQVYKEIIEISHTLLHKLEELDLPPVCSDILERTDAGPGVGIPNVEVRYRFVELCRIHKSSRRNRIHLAREDSVHNEAERTMSCIGEAVVDGSALKTDYFKPFQSMDEKEIEELTIEETDAHKASCMEKNASAIWNDVKCRVDEEPGRPGRRFSDLNGNKYQRKSIFFGTESI